MENLYAQIEEIDQTEKTRDYAIQEDAVPGRAFAQRTSLPLPLLQLPDLTGSLQERGQKLAILLRSSEVHRTLACVQPARPVDEPPLTHERHR